eukprot:scaffold85726_cov31-Tisochrysis_lutea.AAC.3
MTGHWMLVVSEYCTSPNRGKQDQSRPARLADCGEDMAMAYGSRAKADPAAHLEGAASEQ